MVRKFAAVIGLVVVIALLSLAGCSNRKTVHGGEPDEAYQRLEEQFKRGRYVAAAEGLEYYTLNYSGSSKVDSAEFLLGRTHLAMKDYLLAANSFDNIARRFSNSPLVPEAMFMVGYCYWKLSPRYSLDQQYTHQAISSLQAFIDFYPGYGERAQEAQEIIAECREKLAQKEYAAGIIYLKMKDYRAGAVYFQSVIDNYYDTKWASEAAYYLAVCLAGEKEPDRALGAYRDFIDKFPKHPLRSRAEAAAKELANR